MTDDPGPRVHVLSCAGARRDLELVEHFVAHYRDLGVPAERIHLIAHADEDDDDRLTTLLARLEGLGVPAAETWRGVYTSDGLWQRRRALQRRVVPAGDWVLSADADELHVYPAPLAEVVEHLDAEGLTLLQGPMLDRLAPGGELAPVRSGRPLTEQFPVLADVMCPLGGITDAAAADGTVKMMLFRHDVLPGIGGHAPWKAEHGPWRREGVTYAAGRPLADFSAVVDPRWRFAQPAAVHHYKWTAGLADDLRRRRGATGASAKGSAYGDRLVEHLERNGDRVRLKEVAVARTGSGGGGVLRRLLGARRPGGATTGPPDWQAYLHAQRETPEPPLPATPRRRRLSEEPPRAADGWRLRRLTSGTPEGRFHAHSYYDIPVLDHTGTSVVAHEMRVEDRWMTPDDAVTVGLVDREAGGFEPIADTTAWSWQQGPLAQWVPGTRTLVWNDREDDAFVARVHDVTTGRTSTLPRSVYALSPDGETALGLDMARLSRARPGYGYFGARRPATLPLAPDDEGVWRMGLAGTTPELVLPLARAVDFLHAVLSDEDRGELTAVPHLYWFNHVKVSPDGRRFTVKLRWRVASLEQPWRGAQSASLVADLDGTGLRMLCRAASHVMWRDEDELVCWDELRERLSVLRADLPRGTLLRDLPAEVFTRNVHLHPLPEGRYLYDVPYSRTVQLRMYDEPAGTDVLLAELDNHRPPHGPFRCDLHPVPTPDAGLTVVTSLHDGGRQVYVLERDR